MTRRWTTDRPSPRTGRRWLAPGAACALVAISGAAPPSSHAQPRPVAPAASVVPPRLLAAPDLDHPAAARAAKVGGVVVLRLTIDPEGTVQDAAVVTDPGAGLGAAALAAARRFRFEPARRDGRPVAAKTSISHTFIPPTGKVTVYDIETIDTTVYSLDGASGVVKELFKTPGHLETVQPLQ